MSRQYNSGLSRAVCLFFLVAGVVMAFLVVSGLNSMPDKPEAKQPVALEITANAQNWNDSGTGPFVSPAHPISHDGYRQLPLKAKLNPDSLRKTFSFYRGSKTSGYLVYLVISCLVVILLLGGVVYVHRIPMISRDIKKDRDPAFLEDVFKDCGSDINEMRNPRRIKRFSNKVRFHYYYLSQWRPELTYNDLSDVVKILLYLETHHSVMDLERPDGDSEIKDETWFFREVVKKVLGSGSVRKADDPLMAKIFELNKNIVV